MMASTMSTCPGDVSDMWTLLRWNFKPFKCLHRPLYIDFWISSVFFFLLALLLYNSWADVEKLSRWPLSFDLSFSCFTLSPPSSGPLLTGYEKKHGEHLKSPGLFKLGLSARRLQQDGLAAHRRPSHCQHNDHPYRYIWGHSHFQNQPWSTLSQIPHDHHHCSTRSTLRPSPWTWACTSSLPGPTIGSSSPTVPSMSIRVSWDWYQQISNCDIKHCRSDLTNYHLKHPALSSCHRHSIDQVWKPDMYIWDLNGS